MTDEVDRVWHDIVALVMETRGDWRRRVSAATGLPFTRLRVLKRLVEKPQTLSELAYLLSMDAPATTVAVNDLAKRGLVTREEHPDDRRAKVVTLTPAGRAIVRTYKNVKDPAPEPLASISRDDLKTLTKIFATPSETRAKKKSK
jgi:DNA-binding MarR family transcriptional regulator